MPLVMKARFVVGSNPTISAAPSPPPTNVPTAVTVSAFEGVGTAADAFPAKPTYKSPIAATEATAVRAIFE